MSDDDAWRSARRRFYECVEEVADKECHVWTGPRTIHLAGKRGVISPTNFTLAEMGHDLKWHIVSHRTCDTKSCLWPDHLVVFKLPHENKGASWAPYPVPPADISSEHSQSSLEDHDQLLP